LQGDQGLNPIGHVELLVIVRVRHDLLVDGQLDFIPVADIGCEAMVELVAQRGIANCLSGRPRLAFDVESFPALDSRLDGRLEIYLCPFASKPI
jgi:hypothetical protein